MWEFPQAKLRRMVEEHSSSLAARIESDYPSPVPVPVSSPACAPPEAKIADAADVAAASPAPAHHELLKTLSTDADTVKTSDVPAVKVKNGGIQESRRSQSLNNTVTVDSNGEGNKVRILKRLDFFYPLMGAVSERRAQDQIGSSEMRQFGD